MPTPGNGAAILTVLRDLHDKAQALADELAALEQQAREAMLVNERAARTHVPSGRAGQRIPNPNHQADAGNGASEPRNPERSARFANLEFN